MLKIVVYDNGSGGELFANQLESELPVAEIIRVIERPTRAGSGPKHVHEIRKSAEEALGPYFGKVDLIIFANYLLTATSLNYFRRKYKSQKFTGFSFDSRRVASRKQTLVITTRPITRNFAYIAFLRRVRAKTICMDHWPFLMDDDKLEPSDVIADLGAAIKNISNFSPEQILLACGQFAKYTPEFREIFGHNVRIVDNFDETIRRAFRILHIRGGTGKKRK